MSTLSYQLYSSRNFPPLSATFKMLAEKGYKQVEGFGGLFKDVPQLKADLDAAGLTMTSSHFGLDQLENEADFIIETAKTLGIKAVFCPYLIDTDRPKDAAGYVEFGKRLQAIGKPFVDAGLIFGWHNHDFEFVALEDGSIPMDRILEGGPDLAWEADIAWIVRGDGDPLAYIEKHKSRIKAAHVKDIAPAGECVDEDGWADVGHGTMDWAAISKALTTTPCEILVMEHDNPNDDVRFAERSIAAAQNF